MAMNRITIRLRIFLSRDPIKLKKTATLCRKHFHVLKIPINLLLLKSLLIMEIIRDNSQKNLRSTHFTAQA